MADKPRSHLKFSKTDINSGESSFMPPNQKQNSENSISASFSGMRQPVITPPKIVDHPQSKLTSPPNQENEKQFQISNPVTAIESTHPKPPEAVIDDLPHIQQSPNPLISLAQPTLETVTPILPPPPTHNKSTAPLKPKQKTYHKRDQS